VDLISSSPAPSPKVEGEQCTDYTFAVPSPSGEG